MTESSSNSTNGEAHAPNNGDTKTTVMSPLGSCNWIPWDSQFIRETMPDPTRMFSFLVCFIMFFRFLEGHEWDFMQLLTGFFLNPYVMVFSAVACWTFYAGLQELAKRRGQSSLSSSSSSLWDAWMSLPVFDRWTAEWYWWNAWLYHGVMDGASGTLLAVPVVVSQYQILDLRFVNHHSVPWTVGLVEIAIHQPMCLWTLYAVLTKSPYRFPLELITGTLHIAGALIFVFAEVYEGQFNVPGKDPIGVPGDRFGNMKWSHDHFVYYWFGFWFCNFIWVWVPLYRMHRAVLECARGLRIAQQQESRVKQS